MKFLGKRGAATVTGSMKNRQISLKQTKHLLAVVHELRQKCPWDKKQTHRSLIPYLIEEAHEAADALRKGKVTDTLEELGDVLLQIVLHAEIASEQGRFDFEKIAEQLTEKMIFRHPHVFQWKKSLSQKEHLKAWSEIKKKEKPTRDLLGGIPTTLPALQLSQRYGEIAASVGFDWEKPSQVMDKVDEEMLELHQALKKGKKGAIEEELGDVIFSLCQLARHLRLDTEEVLKKSSKKFKTRLSAVEKNVSRRKQKISDLSLVELEELWQRVKRN